MGVARPLYRARRSIGFLQAIKARHAVAPGLGELGRAADSHGDRAEDCQ